MPAKGEGEKGPRRSTLSLSTVPLVRDVLSADISGPSRVLLEKLDLRDASVPAAAEMLDAHISSLIQQAYSLRSDPRFLSLVKKDARAIANLFSPVSILRGKDPSTAPDVDVRGRIRPLGIGDLKVVKQKLLGYYPAEVAHIENVLKGESKERVFRTLDRSETTVFNAEETSEEKTRDTQSTDRFELKKETEQTIKEDMSVQAGVTASGGFGPVTISAHGDFAYSTSKQESMKSSANFARDIVDRSVSKVQKKVTTERTTKVFHETEETDTHGVDNKKGSGNVTGVYRWVEKKYRAQVYNYGRRLMLEFIVPEPAAFFQAAQMHPGAAKIDAKPPEPFLDLNGNSLTPADIDLHSYAILAGRYNAAGVSPPPPEWTYLATAFEQNSVQNAQTVSKSVKDIVIPEGYTLDSYQANGALIWEWHPILQPPDRRRPPLRRTERRRTAHQGFRTGPYRRSGRRVGQPARCPAGERRRVRHPGLHGQHRRVLQARPGDLRKVAAGHVRQDLHRLHGAEDRVRPEARAGAGPGTAVGDRNHRPQPGPEPRDRKERAEEALRPDHDRRAPQRVPGDDQPGRCAQHLPEVDVYESLDEGPIIQFFEQAFDWQQMTYLHYPYFWGRKTKWVDKSNESDPDPLFAEFLQSGAARVVVPASPAYNDAILYFLKATQPSLKERIWNGGAPPTINDLLYKSIADELRSQTDDLAGAKPEGEPWEFTLPTSLVWLQAGPELPTFP